MEALAELVPADWKPTSGNNGYLLVMRESAVNRRERWWKLFLTQRERAIKAQCELLRSAIGADPISTADSKPGPEGVIDPALAKEIDVQHAFFKSLQPDLLGRVASNVDDSGFYRVGNLTFGSVDDEGAISVGIGELPQAVSAVIMRRAAAIRSAVPNLDFDHATVTFTNSGIGVGASVLFSDGSTCGTVFNFSGPVAPQLLGAMLDQNRMLKASEQMGKVAPLEWKDLIEYQRSRVWSNDKPDKTPASPAVPMPHHSRQAELDWLARKSGVEFVADYYCHGGVPMLSTERDQPVIGTVDEHLNTQAVRHDQSWKRRPDGLYLIRNNRWYRDDRLEAPSSLLRTWLSGRETDLKRHADVTTLPSSEGLHIIRKQLDWEAEVVSNLTRWQVETGLALFSHDDNSDEQRKRYENTASTIRGRGELNGTVAYDSFTLMPFAWDSMHIHTQYHTDVFYCGLSNMSRQALVEGRLPFSSLTQKQRDEAIRLTPGLVAALQSSAVASIRLALHPHPLGGVRSLSGVPTMRLTVAP